MKEQILAYLSDNYPWKDRFHYLSETDSTNTRLKILAKEGVPQGTVLLADRQTGGRGRLGRHFHSPAGAGIYMSILLRPQCLPRELMHLTCASAVAMCDAVEAAVNIRPGIKWSNDLVVGQKKIAGILTELGLTPDGKTEYAIIGIGINCCQNEVEFPGEIRSIAGSLASVTGREIDRSRVAAAMMEALWRLDRSLLTDKETILEQYRRDCITLGKPVSLVRGEEVRHGQALDIDEEGALIVRLSSGETETVNSGEVSARGMYGYA